MPPPTPKSHYAECAVTTNFTFLTGASHPEELVARAAELGLAGIGIADRNSLAGIVRAHIACREWRPLWAAEGIAPPKLILGARLVFGDGTPDILAYPTDRAAYSRLCRLLTMGNRRAEKGDCHLTIDDLLAYQTGLSLVVMPVSTRSRLAPPKRIESKACLKILARLHESRPRLGIIADYGPHHRSHIAAGIALAREARIRAIALNDVLYHRPERRDLHDVLTAIREGSRLDGAGTLLEAHAERHLKSGAEMARLFAAYPEAISETLRLLDDITFTLDDLSAEYPDETREGFTTPQAALEHFAWQGAEQRYPAGIPASIQTALAYELNLIATLSYAPYFLTVHEIVRFARSRGILCQGRGSAANSTVCFCLGITEVDPARNDLLFERFISLERREPPDIDVDFEHERREEIMQFIYERYGRSHAGLTASLITYRSRSALREVAKVFGLSEDVGAALSGAIWGRSDKGVPEADVRRLGLDPEDPRLGHVLRLAKEMIGFPRHLGQHSGGFVITRSRLDEVVPIANAAMADRTTVEWDKNDLDALGLLKIDILALGMLTCIRRAFALLAEHYRRPLTLASVPAEDEATYRMVSRADTIGVFQIESRAQMSMLPRLRPASFYDLVIEVAIVRPGPIQGNMVHPYLRRREGLEQVRYPAPAPAYGPADELEQVLGKTLGVPLFQEQAMRIAIVAAGFSPGEADRLRRAMATFRRVGTIHTFQAKMVEGMAARGYDRDFAERCFKQIEGFGEYGFPESHAASFALLVYVSAWLKCRYPDVFAAALLNAQPLGFYAPAQIVRDAREHGVEIREIDVNASDWDASLEEGPLAAARLHARHADMRQDILSTKAIRLGFREIRGLSEIEARKIAEYRGQGYDSVRDLWLRTGLSSQTLERLAEADCFRSLGLERRQAIWAVKGLNRAGDKDDLPLFAASADELEPDAQLPPMPLGAHVVADYRAMALSLKAHPVAFLRGTLDAEQVLPTSALATLASGRRAKTAGLVLVRQRPGTAKGVIFMTIEDETGTGNIIVWPDIFEKFRPIVLASRFVAVSGRLQNAKGIVHLVADALENRTDMLGHLLEANALSPQPNSARMHGQKPSIRPFDRNGQTAPFTGPPDEPPDFTAIVPLARADEVKRPVREDAASSRMWPKGRNFH